MKAKHPFIYEVDTEHIRNSIIILDIDGTLTPTTSMHFRDDVTRAVKALRAHNEVYLCSNGRGNDTLAHFATECGLKFVERRYQKPDPRILRLVPNPEKWPVVVVGDKVLTDGLFAWMIGARFVQVARIKDGSEHIGIEFLYWLDAVAERVFNFIKR